MFLVNRYKDGTNWIYLSHVGCETLFNMNANLVLFSLICD